MRPMLIVVSLLGILVLNSCVNTEETTEETVVYSALYMQPERDSIFLYSSHETWTVTLVGTILNTSERTMTNSGLMTDAQFTVTTVDTSYQNVPSSKATWSSSNPSVASVSNGVITGLSPGYTQVTARIGSTYSKTLIVNVRAVNSAPGLELDPPSAIIIFENFTTVTGSVQSQSTLSVREPQSGFFQASVPYAQDGSFSITVTGLKVGINQVAVRAANVSDSLLYTERYKTVAYYQLNTPDMNAIVGNWEGTTFLTTLKKKFNFSISNSIIPTRYDINGKLDIQFEGIGLVKDVDLIGILNSNGSISATLSKSFEGFSISGKFNGHFKTDGTGSGEYTAQAAKTGWPKISLIDAWTAVKL